MSEISQAEFARLHGVSRKAVTAWKHAGYLVVNESSKVDVEASDKLLSGRPSRARGGTAKGPTADSAPQPALARPAPVRSTQAPRAAPAEPPPAPRAAPRKSPAAELRLREEVLSGLGGVGEVPKDVVEALGELHITDGASLAEAARVKEVYLARLRQLEYAQKSGAVVLIEDSREILNGLLSRAKNKLLSIPARIAPRVAAVRSPDQVKSILEYEIGLILVELTLEGTPHAGAP